MTDCPRYPPKQMKIALFILSALIILASIGLAAFVEPKSGNVAGGGWSVPFWPFVLIIGVALNPYVHDLVKFYLRSKVEIAKAEHFVPETSETTQELKKPVTPPPTTPPEPTDTAKV